MILYGNPVRMIQNWPRILYGQYGPAGGRVGWLKHLRKNPFWEYVSWKTLTLYISLNPDFLIFLQKRRAPKFHAFWRAACAEISHMRPIQARKLKLLKWPFPGDFQVTPTTTTAAAAAARRQFFHLARPPSHSVQGSNIPFGNPSLRYVFVCGGVYKYNP